MKTKINLLDCTLRDGGYYNSWEFPKDIIEEYLNAMSQAGVNIVELGFRSLNNSGFKGSCAFTTDEFINSLNVPDDLTIGVMVNASEIVKDGVDLNQQLKKLFPVHSSSSRVDLVRFACHIHEFDRVLPSSDWLKDQGYQVGYNLMQIADRNRDEVERLSKEASNWPIDVLYFADSMGGMNPQKTAEIIGWLKSHWDGDIGIHTHDNMGMALQNTERALKNDVTWVDSTVTGMGRGPGNAKTEYLSLVIDDKRGERNILPLLKLIKKYFKPMQQKFGWSSNTFYFLSGMYGIHPTFIQSMISDSRYSEEDILSVIDYLKDNNGKSFSTETLDSAKEFYDGEPEGKWAPAKEISEKEILILGTGPGVANHKEALEAFIKKNKPYVIALNTQKKINSNLIDARIACHPLRLLADCSEHVDLPQPLITPASMLPESVLRSLKRKKLLDFGISIRDKKFTFRKKYCELPASLVTAYALAVCTSGKAKRIFLSGFDGYHGDDPRNEESNQIFQDYINHPESIECLSITPTKYDIKTVSVYGLI